MRSGFDNDPYYSSLVLLPVPLNFFMIPFTPFIVLMKSKKLNSCLTYLWYTPTFLISMIGFIIWNLIFLPFAYLVTIYKVWRSGYKSRRKYRKLIKWFGKLIFIIIFGIFYLLLLIILDTIKFAFSLFEKDQHLSKNSTIGRRIALIDIDFIKILIEVLKHYDSDEVETKQVINLLQRNLKIIKQVIEICYKSPKIKENTSKI